MSPKNPEDEASKASGADFSSYREQTILDLPNYAITTEDIMSAQTGISQKKVDKIKSFKKWTQCLQHSFYVSTS